MDALRLFMNEEAIRSCHQDAQAAAGSRTEAAASATAAAAIVDEAEVLLNNTHNLVFESRHIARTLELSATSSARRVVDSEVSKVRRETRDREMDFQKAMDDRMRMDDRERDLFYATRAADMAQDNGEMSPYPMANCYKCRVVTTYLCGACDRPTCKMCCERWEEKLWRNNCPECRVDHNPYFDFGALHDE